MSEVLYNLSGNIATITLNRPTKYNAINRTMGEGVLKMLEKADQDEQVRCVVLTGTGKAFCSGQDLTEIGDPHDQKVKKILPEILNPISRKLRSISKPVLCVVNGPAVGAGANIALCCDIIIAAESAIFRQAFTRIGLISDSGGTYILPRLIGLQRATAQMMLANDISAREATSMGMIYQYFPDKNLEEEAGKIARTLSSMPTKALYYTRMALNQSLHAQSFDEQLEHEAYWQEKAGNTEDFREGVNAFLEKRKPIFKGK